MTLPPADWSAGSLRGPPSSMGIVRLTIVPTASQIRQATRWELLRSRSTLTRTVPRASSRNALSASNPASALSFMSGRLSSQLFPSTLFSVQVPRWVVTAEGPNGALITICLSFQPFVASLASVSRLSMVVPCRKSKSTSGKPMRARSTGSRGQGPTSQGTIIWIWPVFAPCGRWKRQPSSVLSPSTTRIDCHRAGYGKSNRLEDPGINSQTSGTPGSGWKCHRTNTGRGRGNFHLAHNRRFQGHKRQQSWETMENSLRRTMRPSAPENGRVIGFGS